MNFTLSDAEIFLAEWQNKALNNPQIKTIFCPSFTELFAISELLGTSSSELGAQNVFYESRGAFTGEISCAMLKETGCQWVIVGHSERRTRLGDTDEMIHKKLHQIILEDLCPILCIGENIDERNSGQTATVLERQISIACKHINKEKLNTMLIAYEPVWAIGTGTTATSSMVGEAHYDIRNILRTNGINADGVSILYGGSVSVDNAESLSNISDVDGFLIGGASLDIEKFYSIYNKL